MKTCLATLLGLFLFLAGETAAQAQYQITRPTITPYLNLYRGGSSVPLNYQTLVRPEFDIRNAAGNLYQATQLNRQAIADVNANSNFVTGHTAGFMTYGSYFMTFGGSVSAARGAGPGTFTSGGRGGNYAPIR
jgi:hypothetical protein